MTSTTAVSESNDDFVEHHKAQLVLPGSRADEATPIGQPQYTEKRSEQGKESSSLPSRRVPGQTQQLEATSSPLTEVQYFSESCSALQSQLNHSTTKAGLCIICSCTNPQEGEAIVGCTAPEKMSKCFGTDLGFSVKVHSDLSKETMIRLLFDFGRLQVPKSCGKHFRFFFYFFGHGTSSEICLTNGNLERSRIVTEVQKVDESLCKIVLFDSCRIKPDKDESAETHPFQYNLELTVDTSIQATGASSDVVSSLHGGGQEWEERGKYPDSINTLVIYATEDSSKAYYPDSDTFPEMKGCGLVTYFFTRLAPTLNQPLPAVLTEVRREVDRFIKGNCCILSKIRYPQVLVFEDRLMENVNLLAESKGEGRIKPTIKEIKTTPIVTTVQWVFRMNVDDRIKHFKLVCHDEHRQLVHIEEKRVMKNVAEFSNKSLQCEMKYYIKVVAIYDDEVESESEELSFTTSGRHSPRDISTTTIFWFPKRNSPLGVRW
jgi:hypothetical protein